MLAPEGEAVTPSASGDEAKVDEAEADTASDSTGRRRAGGDAKARSPRRAASKQTTA